MPCWFYKAGFRVLPTSYFNFLPKIIPEILQTIYIFFLISLKYLISFLQRLCGKGWGLILIFFYGGFRGDWFLRHASEITAVWKQIQSVYPPTFFPPPVSYSEWTIILQMASAAAEFTGCSAGLSLWINDLNSWGSTYESLALNECCHVLRSRK